MRGWRFYDEGFAPCQLPGKDERLAPITLGLRSLDGIQDMDSTAGDLYHHNGMGGWQMAEQVTLHTDLTHVNKCLISQDSVTPKWS